jgi:hypothetical protein
MSFRKVWSFVTEEKKVLDRKRKLLLVIVGKLEHGQEVSL